MHIGPDFQSGLQDIVTDYRYGNLTMTQALIKIRTNCMFEVTKLTDTGAVTHIEGYHFTKTDNKSSLVTYATNNL